MFSLAILYIPLIEIWSSEIDIDFHHLQHVDNGALFYSQLAFERLQLTKSLQRIKKYLRADGDS